MGYSRVISRIYLLGSRRLAPPEPEHFQPSGNIYYCIKFCCNELFLIVTVFVHLSALPCPLEWNSIPESVRVLFIILCTTWHKKVSKLFGLTFQAVDFRLIHRFWLVMLLVLLRRWATLKSRADLHNHTPVERWLSHRCTGKVSF